jgi:putative ABC transport system permease protein
MNWWQRLRRRDALDRQLDAELRDHLERQIADYIAAGMSPSEARRKARLTFGGLDQVKESCRDARGLRLVEDVVRDVKYASRTLRGNPGFTTAAVLTLAFSIGANAAIFTLLNGLLFRPLPVSDPQRLVFVTNCAGNPRVVDALRQQRDIFASAAGWMATQFSLGAGGETEWVDGLWVTSGYFDTLGVQPAAGRVASDRTEGPPEVMISHSFWQRHFGGHPNAIGRSVVIAGDPFQIVGVTPRRFTGIDVGRTFDVIALVTARPAVIHGADACGPLSVVARLADGMTLARAAAAVRARPALAATRPIILVPAGAGGSELRSRYERPLLTIMAVAGLVLLIACATIGNLLLARATGRRQELRIRHDLGASRLRLVRQMLVESLLLSVFGAVGGLAIAWWGSRLIVRELAAESVLATGRAAFGSARVFLDLSFDWHFIAFTVAMTLVAATLFGVAPALRASRMAPRLTPLQQRRTATGNGLVITQVALSVMLLVAAGLFLRSLSTLLTVPLGFEPRRMLVVDIGSPAAGRDRVVRHLPTYARVRDAVRGVAGVTETTLSVSAPMMGWDLLVEVDTGQATGADAGSDSLANIVSPGWFHTLGTRLVTGRDFSATDGPDAAPVVIVNEAFARQFFGRGEAVGRTVTIHGMGPDPIKRTIVGVTADALWSLRDPVPPGLYVPIAQADEQSLERRVEEQGLTLAVRGAASDPRMLKDCVTAAIAAVDPRLMLTFRSPAEHISASLTQERVLAVISGFFALLALALAAVGLYGVTAYAVARRRTEIGIRLALGGAPAEVMRLILTRVALMVGGGVLAGVLASAWLSSFLSVLLYGVEPRDAVTLVGAVLALAAIAGLAASIPAYRASRLNLARCLRFE